MGNSFFQFASVWWLLGILVIPLLHRRWWGARRPAKVIFPVRIPAGFRSPRPTLFLTMLRYLGVVLLFVALARPQMGYKVTESSVNGIDIMMVLDFSQSMNIEDLSDRPRIDIAKETMEGFIKGRHNDRIGFVMFSGEPLTLVPPTLDYGLVLKSLREAKIGVLRDGTAIGDALAVAVGRLRDSRAKSRVIVLLTDGDNNLGQIDPGTAGDLAVGYGIKVYTIAIGREGRVKLPIRTETPMGVMTRYQWFDNALNPELLKKIADQTHGRFFRVTEGEALDGVFQEIDRLEKTEVKTNEKTQFVEWFEKPLKLAFILLVIEQLLSRFLWRVLP